MFLILTCFTYKAENVKLEKCYHLYYGELQKSNEWTRSFVPWILLVAPSLNCYHADSLNLQILCLRKGYLLMSKVHRLTFIINALLMQSLRTFLFPCFAFKSPLLLKSTRTNLIKPSWSCVNIRRKFLISQNEKKYHFFFRVAQKERKYPRRCFLIRKGEIKIC